ncbi:hypothetical protein K2X89_01485 [Myxococcota bacterium]|nr:hypothetical protein [Myxococcota bacterium]
MLGAMALDFGIGIGIGIGLGLASSAEAHTTVKAQVVEGVREDNALRVGHGCEGERGIVAQSVVFPTDAPGITTSAAGIVLADLAEVIAPGSLAGLVQSIQDRSIFALQDEKLDVDGNVIGFHARAGHLRPNLSGRVPFQFSAPRFLAASCAKRLLVQLAIADICSARPPVFDPRKVNLWIPDNGSQSAVQGRAAGVEGIGEPATLVVNRNLASNPLPTACGAGFDVIITPSAAQIDRDLPIPAYWPDRGGRGSLEGPKP